MKDKSYKLIKDIRVNDIVQTFNPKTMKMSYTRIINQYVRNTDKKCIMYQLIQKDLMLHMIINL